VVAEIALATMLVSSAGLLARSFVNVQQVKLGYKPERLVVMELVNRRQGFAKNEERQRNGVRVRDELVARLRGMSGVRDVALVGELFSKRNPDYALAVADKGLNAERENRGAVGDEIASANFFDLMGARMVEGRTFTKEEEADSKRLAVVVNQRFAKMWWPGESAVGKRFTLDIARPGREWRTVVGVVEDMRLDGREAAPVARMIFATADYADAKIVVRAEGDTAATIGFAKAALRGIDNGAVIHRATTVERQLDERMAHRKLQTSLIGVFAMLTLLLSAVGVAALLHYSVSRRMKEFGIRAAMGATRTDLMRLVAGEGVRMALAGSAIGLLGTLWVNQALVTFLYGVQTGEIWGMSVATSPILAGVALLASVIPAWRGARVDPLESLRHE
jgi:predicted permease